MLFKPEHVAMILEGRKTQTRRVWKRPMAKLGGVYKVKTKMLSKEYHCKIRVTGIGAERLGDITEEDARKEGYTSVAEFMDAWERINGHGWDQDSVVYVIGFELEKDEALK